MTDRQKLVDGLRKNTAVTPQSEREMAPGRVLNTPSTWIKGVDLFARNKYEGIDEKERRVLRRRENGAARAKMTEERSKAVAPVETTSIRTSLQRAPKRRIKISG